MTWMMRCRSRRRIDRIFLFFLACFSGWVSVSSNDRFRERIDAVRHHADIAAIISAAGVKLSGGKNPRGQCPFHGSKSDSLAVYPDRGKAHCWGCGWDGDAIRSEEHRSELQSLMRISYAVFCLKKKNIPQHLHNPTIQSIYYFY